MSKKIHGKVDIYRNDVYYQLMLWTKINKITIVEMQHVDEQDYNQDAFVRDSEGLIHCFETEKMAKEKLIEWYKPEDIDPSYLPKVIDKFLIKE